jgi:sulfur carrier protein ThiS
MRVVVTAYGDLRRYLLDGAPERALDLAAGATLGDLLGVLGATPDDAILARGPAGVLRADQPLAEGERIELFAPVGGG